MGLLEKAGQIDSSKPADVTPEKPVEPEPVAAAPIPEEKEPKSRRGRRKRRKKEPRAKRTRVRKQLPDGFEPATRGQVAVRRLSDFVVSWGWCIPLVVVSAWGSYFDPTYFVVLGLLLIGFNLAFMPYSTGRTVGNWVSRTTYVTSKSERPHQSYILFKGLTFPLVLIGIMLLLTATSTGLKETSGQILLASGLFLVIPPLLDYLFFRIKSDDLGLWDTLYGGVWMVRTTKTAEAKGWLKRLEQLGDYSESQGWWKDKEEESLEAAE
tara:strand:+ start:883 stop:1683 length:801 start_codon:yes stop_codon:yes gene_type:complete